MFELVKTRRAYFIFFIIYFLVVYSLRIHPNIFSIELLSSNPFYYSPILLAFIFWLINGIAILFVRGKRLKIYKVLFFIFSLLYVGSLSLFLDRLKFDYLPIQLLFIVTFFDFESDGPLNDIQITLIQIAKCLWITLYFGAGVFKLFHGEIGWISGENLQGKIIQQYIYHQNQNEIIKSIVEFSFRQKTLLYFSMIGAIIFELTYPLILIKRLRNFYLTLTIFFHIACIIILDTWFIQHLGGIIFWFMATDRRVVLEDTE